MKSPYFNQDHEIFRQTVRQYIETEVRPQAAKWEADERIPKEVWKRMGDLGFLGINHDEAYGGTAQDFFYTVAYLEEIARAGMGGYAAAIGVHQYMSTAHLMKVGSEELKQRILPGAIDGTKWGALGITEPFAGSDVANIRTTAVREGDHYIINGSKTFITNGVFCDFITVACKTDTSAGAGGISLIVVEAGTPGFTASQLKKIGWHSSDTGEIAFDNVKVPVSNLVGEENMGFYYIMDSFQLERLVTGITATEGCQFALDAAMKYMTEREAFGRKLSKFQVLRHRLAELASEIEAVRQLSHHTSWLYSQGEFAVKECSMLKLLSTELGKKAADVCLQCFGGYGFMEEYEIARMYRDARVGTIVGGTSEIMLEIIAKIMFDQVQYDSAYKNPPAPKAKVEAAPAPAPQPVAQANGALNGSSNNTNLNTSTTNTLTMSTPTTAAEIIRSLPERLKAGAGVGVDILYHFELEGPHGGHFTVRVHDGACTVQDGLHGEPKCVVKTTDQTYADTELGRTNAQMAVMMGKIKVSNIGSMMKFVEMFNKIA
jgi:acyl-CoA dehydrogenase